MYICMCRMFEYTWGGECYLVTHIPTNGCSIKFYQGHCYHGDTATPIEPEDSVQTDAGQGLECRPAGGLYQSC